VFDYGHKEAADQMRISWEKLVQYVGATYGQDISNELQNKTAVILSEPVHTASVMTRHAAREQMVRAGQANLQQARRAQQVVLQAAVAAGLDPDAPMKLAILNNAIAEGDFQQNLEVPIELTDTEKTQYNNEWRTYRERNAQLTKHRGQAFSLILGQCTQLLQDKMKQDTDFTTVSTSYDPLLLYRLIEKTILAQTEDQYPFATVYDQEASFYSFRQEQMSNPQWYERFNTRVDVGEAIGVTRQHKVLLEYVAQELHQQNFTSLTAKDQHAIRTDAQERYIAYAFLRQSGAQHAQLKMDLQNDYTTGDNRYPKNRQQTLHLLDKYSKTIMPQGTQSEGASFVQKGGRRKTSRSAKKSSPSPKTYDKEYWKDKRCFKCDETGHPSTHCPNDEDDDDKSRTSQAKSVKKLEREVKSIKKAFAQLKENKEESDISDSEQSGADEEGESHFLCHDRHEFQFAQLEREFEPQIAELFQQKHVLTVKLDLRQVVLLDSQSTIDLVCNRTLVTEVFASNKTMRLKSNGGTMTVRQQATIRGYEQKVWYSERAITNILALSNVIKQYRVTYDSDEQMFIVHRQPHGLPNMKFRMHHSGLHYYDPRDGEFTFVNTVSENMEGFTKRQIQRAGVARTLYATLSYPSWKDFTWIIRSNQIKDCPVTVADVEAAFKIWGKNVAALKGKTVRSKSIPVATDFVEIPKGILNLHRDVSLTADIFFERRKAPQFLPDERRHLGHLQSKNHHVWGNARLQKASLPPDWPVLPSA
jgi:hypothetical protein